jgi:hypothetical protein
MNLTGDLRYVSPADFAGFADSQSAQRRENLFQANKKAIEIAYRDYDSGMSEEAIRQAWFEATPLGSIEHAIAWSPAGVIGSWVAGNPALVLLDDTLFVHGGISPAYARMPIAEINRRVSVALRTRATDSQSIINDPNGPLWYRGLAVPGGDNSESPAAAGDAALTGPSISDRLENLLSFYGAKRIVIGHTPILSGIAILYGGRLIRIDTGISSVYNGQVSYLDILNGTPIAHAIARI